MKYLKNADGQLFRATIVSSIPAGFEDITINLDKDGLEDISPSLLEAGYIEAVEAVEAQPEYWTNGTDSVYDANDIPTVVIDGVAQLDSSWSYVEKVDRVEAKVAYYKLKKKSGADQAMRQSKMDLITAMREPLLAEADIEINKLVDMGQDSSAWRSYRQSLRDVTEPYKKVDGDWKVSVDALIVDDFIFPDKP